MNNKLGELIKNLREERKLSKRRVARDALISDAYLIQIERGDRNPSEKVLRRLAKVLEVHEFVLCEAAGHFSDEEVAQAHRNIDMMKSLYSEKGRHMPKEEENQMYDEYLMLYRHGIFLDDPDTYEGKDLPWKLGPEGWDDLSDRQRKIIQGIINEFLFTDKED